MSGTWHTCTVLNTCSLLRLRLCGCKAQAAMSLERSPAVTFMHFWNPSFQCCVFAVLSKAAVQTPC